MSENMEFNFTFNLTEQEVLSLMEVINRAYEIDYPPLMYYNTLLKLEKKLSTEIENQINNQISNT